MKFILRPDADMFSLEAQRQELQELLELQREGYQVQISIDVAKKTIEMLEERAQISPVSAE